MATTIRSNGLQHAISLGNIEVSTKTNSYHTPSRCYDSEDENMGRKKPPLSQTTGFYPRTSVYSKGDIREQYCLTDRQVSSIERPRRERFFGCWSGRSAPQSFLGVCVGRRAPSDENVADYAPFYKYPRYHQHDGVQYDEDIDSSYFRRRPTSILSTSNNSAQSDAKRYTWMPADEEAVRLEGPRPICSDYDDFQRGPYVVGSYPPKPYLSHSTEQIAGLYRCPAHVGLPPPPPPPVASGLDTATPRTKHVSFARSHTLTSFDEAASLGLRSSGRMSSARSQERLIGGKKATITSGQLQKQQQQQQQQQSSSQPPPAITSQQLTMAPHQMQEILPPPIGFHHPQLHHHIHHQPQQVQQQHQHQQASTGPPPSHHQHPTAALLAQQLQQQKLQQHQQAPLVMQQHQHQQQHHQQQHHAETVTSSQGAILLMQPVVSAAPQSNQHEVLVVEKIKRNAMKTQATQTDVYLNRKGVTPHQLSLSPRTIHRVKMVSQGAQTNGILNGRKLTKSLSEMTGARGPEQNAVLDEPKTPSEHEQLHRTYSEEPPRSPLMVPTSHFDERYFDQVPSTRLVSSSRNATDQTSIHSRNHSQDSATSFRSSDMTIPTPASSSVGLSYGTSMGRAPISSTQSVASMATTASTARTSQDMPRSFSRTTSVSSHGTFDYESNSLPRRTCGHHPREEFYTYSLPRAHAHQATYHQHEVCRHVTECSELLNGTIVAGAGGGGGDVTFHHKPRMSRESSTDSTNLPLERRRASVGPEIAPKTHAILRRQSMPWHYQRVPIRIESRDTSEEVCSTCESDGDSGALERQRAEHVDDDDGVAKDENGDGDDDEHDDEEDVDDDDEEQEIFIDFKPHISPTPSPRTRRKKFQKTLSEGEILVEKRQGHRDSIPMASASEEDLTGQPASTSQDYQYQNLPIKDEGIFDKQNLLALPPQDSTTNGTTTASTGTLRIKREAFRKRSISLEDTTGEPETTRLPKSTPPSPCQEELSVAVQSAYPSTDSLTNDLTRDHSDGIWNESQATVLQAETRENELVPPLLTPSSRRKHLLLQHQQRSSIDTDALDLEEQFSSDQSVPHIASPLYKPASTQTISLAKPSPDQPPSTSTSPTPMTTTPTPSITVIPSLSIDGEDHQVLFKIQSSSRRSSRTLSPSLQERRKIEPMVHVHSPQRPAESPLDGPPAQLSEQYLSRGDSGPKTNTDISECSTNTDDYVTCTDTSKRVAGMKTPPTTASSSSTQVPVSAQSSQTATQDGGSSFESASSLYSTRGDGLSEEQPNEDDPSTAVAESAPATAVPSPSHSVSSSSSGSYNLTNIARKKAASKTTSPLRVSAIVKPTIPVKKKSESISEDERSEKRYSSSGYYESPHDEEHRQGKMRKPRDWNEEERRRRRSNMKLDIERENLRALTSPIKKPSPNTFKQISPEDRTAMNILDGTSPNKATKRFRPKVRRQTRNRSTSGEDSLPRKSKISTSKSPEKTSKPCLTQQPKVVSPAKYPKPHMSPKKSKDESCSEKRLKAKSSESLRSVSPGSDSVFYSEADLTADQQVHCSHCGKEVEIITAGSESHESVGMAAEEETNNGPDIVKPPADFADSPVTTKTSQRLYKKMDKRFRSEERHGDRRHYRSRQENARAKSEERGKDQISNSSPILRPAGSSPCVMPERSSSIRSHSSDNNDQGVYHGNYRLGLWVWLTDRDIWQQHDLRNIDRARAAIEKRGSIETEEEFRKKFQAITHRLVHRKSCFEMYRRQTLNTFELVMTNSGPESLKRKLEDLLRLMVVVWAKQSQAIKAVSGDLDSATDKTITVCSKTGEFGFRIHGSKPVVVSAIEPDTPAECCGLEVGDILLSVNGIPVIDKNHSEVVKIAHDGCDTLEIEVARTIGILAKEQDNTLTALYTGYLWRHAAATKGNANNMKWVRRWFCLRPDHCLYYYKSDADIQPVGAILLTNHTVERCSKDIGKPHAFKIDSNDGQTLYLAADTEEASNRWMAVMSHASAQTDPWLEASTRYLRVPASSVPKADCYGYLLKLGSRWRGWSKRYCVLKDACMYFYQEAGSKTALGMACLQGYRAQPYSSSTIGKKFVFELAPCEGKLRHFYFSTDSELDKKRWIAALDYSIERWMKAG